MSVADNFTDFYSGTSFVFRMAVDEYNAERNWTGLIDRYWLIVEELIADPRAKQLPFMDNPLPTLGMIICYLLWVLLIGPMYMRDRKPMDLRRVIIFYNLFQVLLSGYMFYEHLMAGWVRGYSLTCQTVDYSDSPLSRRMFNLCYVYYLSKLSEFADTVFFVLRKKQSQITDLHVYHHSLTPIEAWILTKFIAGGNATLPNVINNFVHVLMYFYYMLSAMGYRDIWWKKYMTEVQIIQFIICIAHCINALATGCPFPRFITTLLLINASIFLALFMNFYIESYKRKSKSAAAKAASTAATPSIEPAAQEASGVQDLPAGEVPTLPTLPTKADQSGIPAESLEAAVPDAAPLEDINNNSSRTELLESVKKLAEEPLCEADESKVEGSTAEDVFTEAQTKQQQEPTGLRQRLVVEHGEETRTGSTQLAELASG
ncbi:elongation of very long chain fatty acids protein 7 isoform X2 [Anopheles gambiae]|uniref:elongation of very long chain fatty acids protein 7-like isoform X2 n=1 Tax=Anopheles coluzzii TaxID=1518534 RepID=UPI0020FF7DE4|nr:elongation of very long chain fatty acids protein 7-like isoform X2 [Anopheles coluzzii]XP_308627.5 elongation of very long chain fatty acids protein 7 isoform X2 [Anopheles gambiae]